MDTLPPHANNGKSPRRRSETYRLSDQDKKIIEGGQLSIAELNQQLGFSDWTIRKYAREHQIKLPKKPHPVRLYHVVIGKKYGLLMPTLRVAIEGHAYYECLCDCGNTTTRSPRSLFVTRTPSCGCFLVEAHKIKRETDGEATAHIIYLNYKANAIKRNREFLLTEAQFVEISQQNCFYCGCEPSNTQRKGNSATPFTYNGVDRVNNNKDYSIDNCVPCCKRCNVAKSDMGIEEFTNWITRVHANMNRWTEQK